MMENKTEYITNIMRHHEEFIVIGLTGRVGSGCTAAADIFGTHFEGLKLPPIAPGINSLTTDEREKRILYNYAESHWIAFDVIKVRTIITSFLFDVFPDFIELTSQRLNKDSDTLLREVSAGVNSVLSQRAAYFRFESKSKLREPSEQFIKSIDNSTVDHSKLDVGERDLEDQLSKAFKCEYSSLSSGNNYYNRKKLLTDIDQELYRCSAVASCKWWQKATQQNNSNISELLQSINLRLQSQQDEPKNNFLCFMLVHDIIPAISDTIHDLITKSSPSLFTELYQNFGNSIRRTGSISFTKAKDATSPIAKGNDNFEIPRRINHYIKYIRHPFQRNFSRPTRVVIDSIKNVFEALYLRARYTAFYLFAIAAEEDVRANRLMQSDGKNMNLRDIQLIDWNEHSDIGFAIYMRCKKTNATMPPDTKSSYCSENELEFYHRTCEQDSRLSNDGRLQIEDIRRNAYDNMLYPFELQNVGASIENADVFISNNHTGASPNINLRWEIIRNVCLIMHPGLLQPTPVERCMQQAISAKVNSGCISRQVGAVVTDTNYNILSIGWNDVPCGDIPCSQKNFLDLCRNQDPAAFSDYELYNPEFRARINDKNGRLVPGLKSHLCGLPLRYCFKDIHRDSRDAMRTRSMHAEEKALDGVSDAAKGGYLFTTSSPCEMCAKKAKNHQLSKIYYIETYPGISEQQFSNSGDKNNRAKHILFSGAIGRAYMQMYTPIMPHKDLLGLLCLEKDDPPSE